MAKRKSLTGSAGRSNGGGGARQSAAQADKGGAYFFDEATADSACRFIENRCTFWQGDFVGQPFLLQAWQRDEVIRPLFGWKIRDSTVPRVDWPRRYRWVYVEVAKTNGKTPLGAAIAMILAFWDCQAGAEIYSAAADRDQASIVYSDAEAFVRQSPELSRRARIYPGARKITIPDTRSIYKVLTSDAHTKHGLRPLGVIFDELHTQRDRRLYATLERAIRKMRQSMFVMFTTAGEYDPDALWWTEHEYALGVKNGEIRDDKYLPVIYACDPEDDMGDPEMLKKANPSHGVIVDLADLVDDWNTALVKSPAAQAEFKQFHGNIAGESVECPFSMENWRECSELEQKFEGPAYVGVDCSAKLDLTACALWFPETRAVIVQSFMPAENLQKRKREDAFDYPTHVKDGWIIATEGNMVDQRRLRDQILEWNKEYDIKEVGYDARFVTDLPFWLEEDCLEVVEVRQGYNLSGSIEALLGMVEAKELRPGPNPVMRWAAQNTRLKRGEENQYRVTKKAQRKRFDPITALLDAISRSIAHREESDVSFWGMG